MKAIETYLELDLYCTGQTEKYNPHTHKERERERETERD